MKIGRVEEDGREGVKKGSTEGRREVEMEGSYKGRKKEKTNGGGRNKGW